MGNRNGVETPKVTEEEHFSESCRIVYTETTANGARKFVRKCSCRRKNLLSKEFYHHSNRCDYLWRKVMEDV